MAFLRYANAVVMQASVTGGGWGKVRKTAAAPSRNIMAQAAEILGSPFDPDRYLLTHSTIVASVDVEPVPNVKLGKIKLGSRTVNRKYSDYYIAPQCTKFVNNNGDSWSRPVLLASYPTFIGGHNFIEHVQIEEQSRGRIIDAVARDISEDSVYVDILIATDRRHNQLIKDIVSGKMATLSMGCFLPGTMVTMADGTRVPIEDVQPGDMVLTHKGRAREVLNKQIRRAEDGSWKMRTIHAVGLSSPITATDNHPFHVLRPAEVCACGCGEDLPGYSPPKSGLKHKYTTRQMTRRFKVGHDKRILNPNGSYSLDEYRERQARMDDIQQPTLVKVRADELRVGDFITFPRVKDGEHTQEVSEGKARLLGYFLAEGSFNKRNGLLTTVVFSFSMGEKDTYVAEVCRLLEQEFPGKNKPWVQDRIERNTCVVHLTSREAAEWFYKHGGEYSHGKRLSPEAMNWSAENHRHLIGTWLNGDGTCAKAHNGFLSGTTVSLDLASQMHALMAKCGWFARYEARIGSRSVTVAEAVNGGVAVRDEATGRLPSYTLVLSNTQSVELQGYSGKAPSSSRYDNQNYRTLDDWTVAPITEIESGTYEGWVHNMEVDEDHTYVVEGATVSNCSVEETICTKCGNVAVDETELCPCIRFEKLNTFFDDQGNQRVIAELCGHPDIEDNAGVHFIEASWVSSPAFTGAVLRNILQPKQVSPEMARRVQAALAALPPEWDGTGTRKVASENMTGQFDFQPSEETPAAPAAAPAAPKADPIDQAAEEMVQAIRDRAVEKVKDQLRKEDVEEALNPSQSSMAPNETVIKEGYESAVRALLRKASSDVEFLDGLAALNRAFGIQVSRDIYRASLRVGSVDMYQSMSRFLHACHHAAGRQVHPAEIRVMARIGTLLSQLGGTHTPQGVQ